MYLSLLSEYPGDDEAFVSGTHYVIGPYRCVTFYGANIIQMWLGTHEDHWTEPDEISMDDEGY